VKNEVDGIAQYQQKWKKHVARMDDDRLPLPIRRYHSSGRSDLGRPKLIWEEKDHLQDQEEHALTNQTSTAHDIDDVVDDDEMMMMVLVCR
jgi:hypothetical protein